VESGASYDQAWEQASQELYLPTEEDSPDLILPPP
jgi:hypothetical protein